MDKSLKYADILTQVLRTESTIQPRLQKLRISPVCDRDSGQFLIIMTGWEQKTWTNTILFHARLFNDKIIIEDDNFEEGLTNVLIQAGISPEDLVTGLEQDQNDNRCRVGKLF
jgi:XisI protein